MLDGKGCTVLSWVLSRGGQNGEGYGKYAFSVWLEAFPLKCFHSAVKGVEVKIARNTRLLHLIFGNEHKILINLIKLRIGLPEHRASHEHVIRPAAWFMLGSDRDGALSVSGAADSVKLTVLDDKIPRTQFTASERPFMLYVCRRYFINIHHHRK